MSSGRDASQMGMAVAVVAAGSWFAAAQTNVISVPLTYHAPGSGPRPNFSPKGTQVTLTDVRPRKRCPGARCGRPRRARAGWTRPRFWIRVLATASAAHPSDLTQLYIDTNRNGDFADDASTVAT